MPVIAAGKHAGMLDSLAAEAVKDGLVHITGYASTPELGIYTVITDNTQHAVFHMATTEANYLSIQYCNKRCGSALLIGDIYPVGILPICHNDIMNIVTD